jgi:AraC-like DNA-binding protein
MNTKKTPPEQHHTFVAQMITLEAGNIGRHQHVEHEVILFTAGSGIALVGDYEGKFKAGDIFFVGSNLPHSFQSGKDAVTATVVQFRDNCLGNYFLSLPECAEIRQLFETAAYGLQFKGDAKKYLHPYLQSIANITGINRIIFLLDCLDMMISEKGSVQLSKKKAPALNNVNGIEKVVEFTLMAFNEPISLSQVALVACMSVPSFCNSFKQHTHKTYIDFLNEIRIKHACRQLLETPKPVNEICYESGYNTVAHFHRQFFRLKQTTPLQYRKMFSSEVIPSIEATDQLTA